jgi:hypothetical protein
MAENIDMVRLASVAKIGLTDAERTDIKQYIETAFFEASSDIDAFAATAAAFAAASDESSHKCAGPDGTVDSAGLEKSVETDGPVRTVDIAGHNGTVDIAGPEKSVETDGFDGSNKLVEIAPEKNILTIHELREDIPVRNTWKERIFEQSPSDGGEGFTIRQLVE